MTINAGYEVVPGLFTGKSSLALGESALGGRVVRLPFSREKGNRPTFSRKRLIEFSIGYNPMRGSKEITAPLQGCSESGLFVRIRTRDTQRERTGKDTISGGIPIIRGTGFESADQKMYPFVDALLLLEYGSPISIRTPREGVVETRIVLVSLGGQVLVFTDLEYAEKIRLQRERRAFQIRKLQPTRLVEIV